MLLPGSSSPLTTTLTHVAVTGFGSTEQFRDFLNSHRLAVVATTAVSGQAQSAVIEFGSSEDLKLIFDTYRSSRKYMNLKRDNRASFVIGWDDDITLQYEGAAVELKSEELGMYQSIYFKQVPGAAKFCSDPDVAFFVVTPSWIRLTDLRVTPWRILEKDFKTEEP